MSVVCGVLVETAPCSKRPLLLGRVEHPQVVYTHIGLRRRTRADKVGYGYSRQQSDNRHDYHYLDQCKPPPPMFHGLHFTAFLFQRL
jgi:hypothetical protein